MREMSESVKEYILQLQVHSDGVMYSMMTVVNSTGVSGQESRS